MLISYSTRRRFFERARQFFGGLPCRVQVAALPWRLTEGAVEVMLVTSRGTGRWGLPKGWPEANESLAEAAAREAAEEAGISGGISSRQAGTFYYEKVRSSGLEWHCEVHVFALEVDAEAQKWPEMKKRRRQWFSVSDAASLVSEPDLAELIERFGANPRKIAA